MTQREHSALRVMQLALIATVCALVAPTHAQAQTCVGLPGPENGRMQVGLGRTTTEGVRQLSLNAGAVGSKLFGQYYSSTINYDNSFDARAVQGAGIGYRLPIRRSGSTELCPHIGGSVGDFITAIFTPPNSINYQRTARTTSANAGLSLGQRIGINDALTVIPAVSASFVRTTFKDNASNVNVSSNYGAMTLSTGLVLVTHFTVYPAVTIPIGLEGASTEWGVAFTVSFWRAKKQN